MAELRRAVVSTLMVDGDRYPAAAYTNRTITLVLQIWDVSDDDTAAALQALFRELDRPRNILRYRPGTSVGVHFRTFRTTPDAVTWDPVQRVVTAQVPAEPFALGLRVDLPPVIVYNDPAEGTTLNSNPFFTTSLSASGWTGTGGTVARDPGQAHEGTGSLLLTPDGVTATVTAQSELVPVTAGVVYRASAWQRCAAARSVSVGIGWYTAAGAFVSSTLVATSLAATTWTEVEAYGTAPPTATQARLIGGSMGSTPPGSHLLWIDEARIRRSGGPGGMCFDISGVLGDVETPLMFEHGATALISSAAPKTMIGIRRRGTVTDTVVAVGAEELTGLGADTTLQTHDGAMSGGGDNYLRVSFSTTPAMTHRGGINWTGTAMRGTYRVLARVRRSDATSVIRMRVSSGGGAVVGDPVVVPLSTTTRLVDLGLMAVPSCADPVVDGYSGVEMDMLGGVGFGAERVSGSGTLDVDYLLVVPADDALMVVDWPDGGAGTDPRVRLDGTAGMGYVLTSGGAVRRADQTVQIAGAGAIYALPGQVNRITWARSVDTALASADSLNDTTTITVSYWPRHLYVAPVGS
ncbi:carbohydrate binding domain-containing protein [Micromonospora sp. NPDC048986]|uniref:carbohydrate binding domain-containing protein n=1 Tax=Micromonospora sp. NPDC048986 TaxID=3155644 RepID=UPI0033F7C553